MYAGRPAPGRELTKDYNVLEAGLSMAVSVDKGFSRSISLYMLCAVRRSMICHDNLTRCVLSFSILEDVIKGKRPYLG